MATGSAMSMMVERPPLTLVTVFGGTGFLGRRIVERLTHAGVTVRVAVRHPEQPAPDATLGASGRTIPIAADVRDEAAVAAAVTGVEAVVNAVSAYVEKGGVTYTAVHVHGASNVATACKRHNVGRLVHISGLGADPASRSPYIRARGRGELSVREALPGATILRPSVMFASDDAFLNNLAAIARSTSLIPLIGGGHTRMQPVHASDVAAAVELSLRNPAAWGKTYELGGPERFTMREIAGMILVRVGRRHLPIPVPFALAHPLARLLELLPGAPLTVAQVDLLAKDNIPGAGMPGLGEFDISPQRLQDAIAVLTPRK
ncbi:MAG: complex I NDUFA9 subunit family protein [Pseudomonadota bacterium]|nr:complex I NDUFA9 subunit family protein [Pseudomonadota bacterium]